MVQRQLALLGYVADVVADGEQAWERWQEVPYALLLTDLHMPALDGYGLTRRIRSAEAGQRRVPIIALTANALRGEVDRCLQAGMDAYLAKPVMLGDLRSLLERWMGTQPETPQPAPAPLSMQALHSFLGDDPQELARFLRGFQANASRLGASIDAAWNDGDLAEVGVHAHTLKTSARMVGADQLAALCEVLETAGREGDRHRVEGALQDFRDALQRSSTAAMSLAG